MAAPKKLTLSLAMEWAVYVLMAVDLVLMILLPWLTATITARGPGKELYADYLVIYTPAVSLLNLFCGTAAG